MTAKDLNTNFPRPLFWKKDYCKARWLLLAHQESGLSRHALTQAAEGAA
jgi:hypothetical protein